MKTWGGRFAEPPDQLAAEFGQSVEDDRPLALDDIDGSIAWARALSRAGLLDDDELAAIDDGLRQVRQDVEAGRLSWDPALEDVHMNIEAALEARIGAAAHKLHTGRSRNDQVSTDLRLWLRRALRELDDRLVGLERSLLRLARRHPDAVMPGHTHAQPAQPVLFAHHLLAHAEMLERDRERFGDAGRRANVSPLGSGALAGSGFPIDRQRLAEELGFDGVSANSIDASGDRDFAVEVLAAAALCMAHLSRLAEEIAWWSSPRFGFVRPSDAFSTGSSMMPNKRNPDPAELVRGRAAVAIGRLGAALGVVKGLPLGYQRDLQELKPLLFDGVGGLSAALAVLDRLAESLRVDEERMRHAVSEGFTTATALADALVEEGVPFRAAHHIVGVLVRRAESTGVPLPDLAAEDVAAALADSPDPRAQALGRDPAVPDRLCRAATIEAALARCDVVGGTAPARVHQALDDAARRLGLTYD